MATFRALLESALTTGSIQGQVPKEIRIGLIENNRRANPLYGALPRQATQTNKWFWNSRQSLPQGGFSNEAPTLSGVGSVTESSSTYLGDQSVNIRNLTYRGNVSKIAEQVATRAGRVIENEMKGQAESVARDETITNLYGYEAATVRSNRTQWTGFEGQVALANKIKVNGPIALPVLDSMYDQARIALGAAQLGGNYVFALSHRMETGINTLFSNTNRTNLPMMEIKPEIDADIFGLKDAEWYGSRIAAMAGVEVKSYRGVPIVPTDFVSPSGQMGAVTTGAGAISGTTATAVAAFYRVEAVTQLGKTVASGEVNVTPALGGSNLLSWATPVVRDRFGAAYPVLLYRVFKGSAAGAETLYAIVGGFDQNDNPVTSFTDDYQAHNPLTNAADTSNAYVFAAPDGVSVPATATNIEDIFLVPIDPEIATMAVLNELQQEQLAPVSSRSVQFETTEDAAFTMLSPYFAAMATGVTHS